ncbi:MAG TPA: glycosyltransferase [Casimicrobiaceae bacterium]
MLTTDVDVVQNVRPYSIEVVPVDRGWILERIATAIAREAECKPDRYHVTVTAHPSGRAELTLFLPESAWRDDLRDTIRVTYLAHKEDHPGAAALFEEVARKSDCCITSSSKYADVLRADGAREVVTIPLGVDTGTFVPKVRIGVVGRTYHTGRKGESLLARSLDLPFVEFVFTGEGWPLPARYYSERDLVAFYQSLDYLLVPSLIEGGPVPMLEALATGCRIIAPSDIGMVRDFPHIRFHRGDAEDLRRVLQRQIDERLELRAAALPCDWRHFAQRHLELFGELIERKRMRSNRRSAAVVSDGRRTCHALLLTHGPEETAKGGPTTRVQNIVGHLRARGLPVEAGRGASAIAADRYDVVHVFNSWPPDSALTTLVAARRAGAKVVFSPIALDLADWPLFHPFMEKLLGSAASEVALRASLARIRAATRRRRYGSERDADVPIEPFPGLFEKLRLCCDLADRLVLLSECERAYLVAIGARIDHAVIIRNGVDVDRMAEADPALFRAKFGLDRYLLCVGRIEYRKNQALAAMALRGIDIPFVLVGAPGDAGYVEHVRRVGGRNLRLIERIEDRRLLASAYAGASAFVFPSWIEGAPLAAMEAGAAGTPLVLGAMSSEEEHFGRDARYVHPADVDSIGAAVTELLTHPEDASQRAARAQRSAAAFSIARHADETWSLYESLRAAEPRSRPLVLDVSALLHFVRVRQPFTGVPLVERNLLHELAAVEPSLRTIVYNDVKERFIQIDAAELTDFDEPTFNARHWFRSDDGAAVDCRAVLQFADRSTPTLPEVLPSSRSQPRFRTKAIAMGKRAMQRVPRTLRDPAIALVQRVRPGFDPFRLPPDYLAVASQETSGAALSPPQPTDPADAGVPRFEDPLATLLVYQIPRHRPIVPVGARLLSLGQSWLSNGPLLDELVRLTETRALSLEPYVYDLTYHTGAHQTGWADNDERFARLLKLLRHSRMVFTESRQVEEQLQKLRASRGLAYGTRRTALRGRDLPDADGVPAPRYRPDTFVLVVASFNKRKNHEFLIRVWTDLYETWIRPSGRDFRLVLVGQVQEERKYADPSFVAHLERSNIDVYSDLPDAALSRLIQDCAFTAYPSLQEGWGLPAQESIMCGKVCLVSSVLPVAEEIDNPALIRLVPDDFYGWYEALKTWLDNHAMRRAFSERAKEYVAPSWRTIAERIIDG